MTQTSIETLKTVDWRKSFRHARLVSSSWQPPRLALFYSARGDRDNENESIKTPKGWPYISPDI
jgi:hypothetical protein